MKTATLVLSILLLPSTLMAQEIKLECQNEGRKGLLHYNITINGAKATKLYTSATTGQVYSFSVHKTDRFYILTNRTFGWYTEHKIDRRTLKNYTTDIMDFDGSKDEHTSVGVCAPHKIKNKI